MSLIRNINKYESQSKQYTLNNLVNQFSGIILVDYIGQLSGQVDYIVNDGAISFTTPLKGTDNTSIDIIKQIRRAWALPGYILSESAKNTDVAPAITLPTLPFGYTSSDPGDVLLITTIPKYWYPEVPNGDRLVNYELAFDRPFFEVKNNRQLFKVKQHNILEEGVMILQLSSIPVSEYSNLQTNSINSLVF